MEERPTYLGTKSDYYTHVHDLPPQLGGDTTHASCAVCGACRKTHFLTLSMLSTSRAGLGPAGFCTNLYIPCLRRPVQHTFQSNVAELLLSQRRRACEQAQPAFLTCQSSFELLNFNLLLIFLISSPPPFFPSLSFFGVPCPCLALVAEVPGGTGLQAATLPTRRSRKPWRLPLMGRTVLAGTCPFPLCAPILLNLLPEVYIFQPPLPRLLPFGCLPVDAIVHLRYCSND